MLAWWTFAIAVAAVVPGPAPVKSAISFPNTDVALLAKVSLLSPTMTYFLGPQACDPGPPTVSGPVVIYSAGDSCDPAALPPSVQGRIVFLNVPGGACSFEESYLRFSDLGISAIFSSSPAYPGFNANLQDGTRGRLTRGKSMLWLTGLCTEEIRAAIISTQGLNATLVPDVNPWTSTFDSWCYQVFVRIIPSTICLGTGATALVFLILHVAIFAHRYSETTPPASQSMTRRVRFVLRAFDFTHVALAIEFPTITALGIFLAVSGFYSTDAAGATAVNFFSPGLSGFGFACSTLSSMLWYKKHEEIRPQSSRPSLLHRVFRGDYPAVTACLCIAPIFLDILMGICLAFYFYFQVVQLFAAFTYFVMQFLLSIQLFTHVTAFHRDVTKATALVSQAVSSKDSAMMQLLRRLAVCAGGLSISMLMYCAATIIIAFFPAVFYYPTRWTVTWSIFFTGRALDSAFRVAMFKPRKSNRARSSGAASCIAPRTADLLPSSTPVPVRGTT